MAEIRTMLEAGQYFPPAPDAPEFELDDDFWKNTRRVERADKTAVTLELTPSTIEAFRRSGPDYLERMADVLERQAKKAS